MPAGASASDGSSSGTRHPPSGFPTLGPQAPSTIALLIAGISILGAIAAARAAWAAQEATLVERRHVQALMLRELRLLEIQGQVDHDYRLAGLYASFALGADHLQREAEALRATQPDRAAWFDLRAQEERARRRAIVPFFRVALPSTTNGIPAYDRDEIVRRRVATNRELREISADIRDSGTQPRARTRHDLAPGSLCRHPGVLAALPHPGDGRSRWAAVARCAGRSWGGIGVRRARCRAAGGGRLGGGSVRADRGALTWKSPAHQSTTTGRRSLRSRIWRPTPRTRPLPCMPRPATGSADC